ncbi:unnamed protein product [Owenia fusiformis]|uniref:Uncharacterized protein n=1 Tax=Owenia fusiformis TaxID=6347 RepID=A0A8J1XSZ7_OWEFU|nr:unnamed protein product [Owenia fusiformis]
MPKMTVSLINGSYLFEPSPIGLSIVFIALDFIGVLSNLCIIYIITRTRPLWSTSGHYMFVISLLDCLTCWNFIAVDLQVLDGEINVYLCTFNCCLSYGLIYSRMWIFVCMSVDRAVMLRYPLRYATIVTTKATKVVLGIVCTCSMATMVPIALQLIMFREDGYMCDLNYTSHSPYIYVFMASCTMCIGLIILTYINIFLMVRTQQKKINVIVVEKDNSIIQTHHRKNTDFKLKIKAIRMLLFVIGTFYLAWGPFLSLIIFYEFISKQNIGNHHLTRLCFIMMRVSFSMNFFIYLFTDRVYKKGFKRYMLYLDKNKVQGIGSNSD